MAITLTKKAETKVKEILPQQPEVYKGLRIQVVAGGCSGYQYRMRFDTDRSDQGDTIFEFDGLKVFVDKASLLFMDGVEVDYVERLDDAGFKFSNPNATGSCGVAVRSAYDRGSEHRDLGTSPSLHSVIRIASGN